MDPSVLTIAKIPALPVGAIIAYVVFMFAFMILSIVIMWKLYY